MSHLGDVKKMVRQAVKSGDWETAGRDGNDHGLLRHVPTGETTSYPLHRSGDRNSVRNVARAIKDISGLDLFVVGGRRPSRKAAAISGYSSAKSQTEMAMSAEISSLLSDFRSVEERLVAYATTGRPTRSDVNAGSALIERRAQIVDRLNQLHHPIPESRLSEVASWLP